MAAHLLEFEKGWDEHFRKFDASVRERIWKKVLQLEQPLPHRHLKHGLPFFVEEVGGYRIVFEVYEKEMTKRIHFIGNHKQYEAWYSS